MGGATTRLARESTREAGVARALVVTGASAVIGRGADGLDGARRDVEAAGGEALAVPVDVADPDAVLAAADGVAADWGRIDVWVNSATRHLLPAGRRRGGDRRSSPARTARAMDRSSSGSNAHSAPTSLQREPRLSLAGSGQEHQPEWLLALGPTERAARGDPSYGPSL